MSKIKVSEVKNCVIESLNTLEKCKKEIESFAMIVMDGEQIGVSGEFEPLRLFRAILSFLAKVDVLPSDVALGIFEMVKGFCMMKMGVERTVRRKEVN